MDQKKVLGASNFTSKLPARTGSKIPGPTPNKGILKQGTKRDSASIKENVAIAEPPAKKVSVSL